MTAMNVWTILGWTPALRTPLSWYLLPCGCSVGVYETWNRGAVHVLDLKAPQCRNVGHTLHTALSPPNDSASVRQS